MLRSPSTVGPDFEIPTDDGHGQCLQSHHSCHRCRRQGRAARDREGHQQHGRQCPRLGYVLDPAAGGCPSGSRLSSTDMDGPISGTVNWQWYRAQTDYAADPQACTDRCPYAHHRATTTGLLLPTTTEDYCGWRTGRTDRRSRMVGVHGQRYLMQMERA